MAWLDFSIAQLTAQPLDSWYANLLYGLFILSQYIRMLLISNTKVKKSLPFTNMSDNIQSIIKGITSLKFTTFILFGSRFFEKKSLEPEVFPPELLDHKFLMHPIRLAMTKILFENSFMTSSE